MKEVALFVAEKLATIDSVLRHPPILYSRITRITESFSAGSKG